MRVLLTTVGSSGDINPFIALGRALKDRGHNVWILINPFFESAARQAGLEYLPLGEELDFRIMATTPNATHPRKGGLVVLRELVFPHVKLFYDTTLEAIQRVSPDIVVAHHIVVGARWACERAGIPHAVAVLAPGLWLNPQDPSIFGAARDEMPRWLSRPSLALARRLLRWKFDPSINRIRRELGLKAERDHVFLDAGAGVVNLGLWSSHFRAPLPGDPPQGVICGFPWHDRFERFEQSGDHLEAMRYLEECHRSSDPPIVFTLGTAVVHVAGRFYHDAAAACRALGRRGILITNRPEYAPKPSELPPGVRAFSYAPFSSLFPGAAVNVHHGGIGTTAQGLRSGRPTLIIPHAYDQFDNAARAKRLGVSLTLARSKVTTRSLTDRLKRILESPSFAQAAGPLGTAIRNEDGASVAAGAVEMAVGQSN